MLFFFIIFFIGAVLLILPKNISVVFDKGMSVLNLGLRPVGIQLLGARMIYAINASASYLHLCVITNCGNVHRQCSLSGRQISGYSVILHFQSG
jgi:hypothetical protein